MNLKALVRDIPDFPKPGILFRDITPLLAAPAAFNFVIEALAKKLLLCKVDCIVGIEARGFIFGAPLALQMQLPFVPARKAGKLPATTHSVEYALEYGSAQLEIHSDAIKPKQRVAIVDDLLATGGTAAAAGALVKKCGGEVAAYAFLIELNALKGRSALESGNIFSLIEY